MMLIATITPSERANSSASRFLDGVTRLRNAPALFVDRLEPEEHVLQAEPLPEAEDVLVAQQHVAAGLQVVLLVDPAALDASPIHRRARPG